MQDLTSGGIACLAQDRERGDLEEAASLWRSIVERTSEDDFVFPNLGILLLAHGLRRVVDVERY